MFLFDVRHLIEQHPPLGGVLRDSEPMLVECAKVAELTLRSVESIEHSHRLGILGRSLEDRFKLANRLLGLAEALAGHGGDSPLEIDSLRARHLLVVETPSEQRDHGQVSASSLGRLLNPGEYGGV